MPTSIAAETTDKQIGITIRMLGELLGQTIIQQAGQEVYDLEEEIRGLSKSWRQGDESANALSLIHI